MIFFSRVLRDSTPCFVGPFIRWSVRHALLFLVFAVFGLTAPAQVIKWPQIQPLPTHTRLGEPCIQPCCITNWIAVYPALFELKNVIFFKQF